MVADDGDPGLISARRPVKLQPETPGDQQIGNFNVSGTGIAGRLEAADLSIYGGDNDDYIAKFLNPGGAARGVLIRGAIAESENALLRVERWDETPNFVVTGAGRVGIGTAIPQAKLDVAGVARCDVVEIDGGADISEPFDVSGIRNESGPPLSLAPGMVVCIDPGNPGALRLSTAPYDHTVAGVISLAEGVKTELTLRQDATATEGTHAVALTGRVYTWCETDSGGPIEPGDLLTTSSTPGHAMKVTDHERSNGAILGKAMTRLESRAAGSRRRLSRATPFRPSPPHRIRFRTGPYRAMSAAMSIRAAPFGGSAG